MTGGHWLLFRLPGSREWVSSVAHRTFVVSSRFPLGTAAYLRRGKWEERVSVFSGIDGTMIPASHGTVITYRKQASFAANLTVTLGTIYSVVVAATYWAGWSIPSVLEPTQTEVWFRMGCIVPGIVGFHLFARFDASHSGIVGALSELLDARPVTQIEAEHYQREVLRAMRSDIV